MAVDCKKGKILHLIFLQIPRAFPARAVTVKVHFTGVLLLKKHGATVKRAQLFLRS